MPGGKTHTNVRPPCGCVPLEFFSFRLVHIEPALALVPREVFALGSCAFLCLPVCLYNFGGNDLPCDLTCLMNLNRVTDFSVCPAFTCS